MSHQVLFLHQVLQNLEGYSIYLNKRISSYDGKAYMKYRIGTPTRSVVAAGHAALRGASATA